MNFNHMLSTNGYKYYCRGKRTTKLPLWCCESCDMCHVNTCGFDS